MGGVGAERPIQRPKLHLQCQLSTIPYTVSYSVARQ